MLPPPSRETTSIPVAFDAAGGELVPTSGVLAQARTFDQLGRRYDLCIHTGGDPLAFAVEDRFGDAVGALGHPVAPRSPGAFTYDWYPSLDDPTLVIGATGDYWIRRAGRTVVVLRRP